MEDKKVYREYLMGKLAELAMKGPIPAKTTGDTAVGITLLNALGIENTSLSKANYHGIGITAHRRGRADARNRVNLFAQVPDWSLSNCKSSREIVEKYGYDVGPNRKRLYCTLSSRVANSQGLKLKINRAKEFLEEVALINGEFFPVATWRISKLKDRLLKSHPESFWVKANVYNRDDGEYFHYREVVYTGPPKADELIELLDTGTITVDHLISLDNGRAYEKGPLFKINPYNFELLFPAPKKYDLMTFSSW